MHESVNLVDEWHWSSTRCLIPYVPSVALVPGLEFHGAAAAFFRFSIHIFSRNLFVIFLPSLSASTD
jgi:hypothetical protein